MFAFTVRWDTWLSGQLARARVTICLLHIPPSRLPFSPHLMPLLVTFFSSPPWPGEQTLLVLRDSFPSEWAPNLWLSSVFSALFCNRECFTVWQGWFFLLSEIRKERKRKEAFHLSWSNMSELPKKNLKFPKGNRCRVIFLKEWIGKGLPWFYLGENKRNSNSFSI